MTKKQFNATIDDELLEIFDVHAKSRGFNKSALVEIWMKDWLKSEGVKLDES